MMFGKFLIGLGFSLHLACLIGQSLALPIDFRISLAGNYAELRKNHFHMGLDFRTDGKENIPVLAVEDGYVSRIVISPNGYGKAIYIVHPSLGLTTVYAHLNAFRPDLEWWIGQAQYARQIHVIDTSFIRPKFFVKKGEMIALSGNTGGSEAPHLHFEIRNTLTEKTINPLHFFPTILDTLAPKLDEILFYHVDSESIFMDRYPVAALADQTIQVNTDKLGLAVAAIDKMNNTPNVFGVYAIRLYENNKLIYQLKLDSLDFNWQSHIRAASDYGPGLHDVYKVFYEHCSFNLSDSGSQNGIIYFKANEVKNITIEVYDFNGNKSEVHFQITSTADFRPSRVAQINCYEEQIIHNPGNFQIIIPKKGLAENYHLTYTIEPKTKNDVFKVNVMSPSIAALRPYQLTYFIPPHMQDIDKLYLESMIDKKTKSYKGILHGESLTFPNLKNYGLLTIKYDKTKPRISEKLERKATQLIFTATDDESGVSDYQFYVNGQWRKLYFDEKNNQFIYTILPVDKGKKFNTLIEITDKVGNKNSRRMEILF